MEPGAITPGFKNWPEINNAGDAALQLYVMPSGVSVEGEQLLVRKGGQPDFEAIAAVGSQAPGMPSGTNFRRLGYVGHEFSLNESGHVASLGTVFDSTYGIWAQDQQGDLQLVALTNQAVPGLPDYLLRVGRHEGYQYNDRSQVAFDLELIPSLGTTGEQIWGLFLWDGGGLPDLIARTGDLIEIAPGDVREILRPISFDSLQDLGVFAPRINARGDVLFYVLFTDGSEGVFVNNAFAIPEPRTMALAALVSMIVTPLVFRRSHCAMPRE